MRAGILDTNVILRFFLNDHREHAAASSALFTKAEMGELDLFLADTIVAEVTFVMEKVYKKQRAIIADALLDFIQNPGITLQSPSVLTDALLRYRAHAIDFPDALVAAMAAGKGIPAISFDRDLDCFTDVTRFQPQ
jgi:predicted nucleic-acid-binding protein